MDAKYYLHTKKCDFTGIGRRLGVDPVVVRLMYNRDVQPQDMAGFLNPGYQDLHHPSLLPDAAEGARILADRIRSGSTIRIIGDYDVDGVCAAYILYQGLRDLGADVDWRIPERERHGYGLHQELIDLAHAEGRQVILTCDNGISEHASIERAKAYGMTVIVTDHHNVSETLPPADAVIDPKRKNADGSLSYPFTEICGAVVAMKFLQMLYAQALRDPDAPLAYLDIAALATVCDVMPLTDENRFIVSAGLKIMSCTRNMGLAALIRMNQITDLKAWHFGFILGPCINAAGRLKTADEAMKLLLADSEETAMKQALVLKELNEQRKTLTEEGVREAFEETDRPAQAASKRGGTPDRVLVIHLPQCPDSIAGIVAGKVREKVYRPVLIATGTGDVLKGSARSIPGYSLFDEMAKEKDLFIKYGGHPLAAGFTIRRENLDLLRKKLNKNCSLTDDELTEKKYIDIRMPLSYVSIPLLEQISLLEPYGTGNPAPVFAERSCILTHAVRIGKERNYLRFTLRTADGFRTQAVYFGDADAFLNTYRNAFGRDEEENLLRAAGRRAVSFTYDPQIHTYRGETGISFKIKDFIF